MPKETNAAFTLRDGTVVTGEREGNSITLTIQTDAEWAMIGGPEYAVTGAARTSNPPEDDLLDFITFMESDEEMVLRDPTDPWFVVIVRAIDGAVMAHDPEGDWASASFAREGNAWVLRATLAEERGEPDRSKDPFRILSA